jgi:hypothetical protein
VNMLDWDRCSRRKGRPAAGPRGHHVTGPLKLAAEISTSEGKLQLASVLDILSRRVLGFGPLVPGGTACPTGTSGS